MSKMGKGKGTEGKKLTEVFDVKADWHHKFKPGVHVELEDENFVVCEMKGHLLVLMNVKVAGELKVDTKPKGVEK